MMELVGEMVGWSDRSDLLGVIWMLGPHGFTTNDWFTPGSVLDLYLLMKYLVADSVIFENVYIVILIV